MKMSTKIFQVSGELRQTILLVRCVQGRFPPRVWFRTQRTRPPDPSCLPTWRDLSPSQIPLWNLPAVKCRNQRGAARLADPIRRISRRQFPPRVPPRNPIPGSTQGIEIDFSVNEISFHRFSMSKQLPGGGSVARRWKPKSQLSRAIEKSSPGNEMLRKLFNYSNWDCLKRC